MLTRALLPASWQLSAFNKCLCFLSALVSPGYQTYEVWARETFIPWLSLILGQRAGTQQLISHRETAPPDWHGLRMAQRPGQLRKARTDHRWDSVPLGVGSVYVYAWIYLGLGPLKWNPRIHKALWGRHPELHMVVPQTSNVTGGGRVCQTQKNNKKQQKQNKENKVCAESMVG